MERYVITREDIERREKIRRLGANMLLLASKGFLLSSEPEKRYKKLIAINKIRNQPFFGEVDCGTIKIRRPVPYTMTSNE